MNHNVFQCDVKKTQYSSIPLFHHSNCERSELSSFLSLQLLRVLRGSNLFDDNNRGKHLDSMSGICCWSEIGWCRKFV